MITIEINAKQKYLEILENVRECSDFIRQQYETHIKLLFERIQNVDDEKQVAVTKLNTTTCDQHNIEELKLTICNYEEKMRQLETENNKLSALRAQYLACLKDSEYYKSELEDLRKLKVQLTRGLYQEFLRHKQAEQAKAREIATFK